MLNWKIEVKFSGRDLPGSSNHAARPPGTVMQCNREEVAAVW